MKLLQKVVFFFPSFTHFFITTTYQRFWLALPNQKTVCLCQNLFFLQNKGSNNPIRVGRHTKNNLRLFKLDSKTLLVWHSVCSVNQMTKYEGYLNFDLFRRYFNKNYWERPSTKAIYGLWHKGTQTGFSTNCNTAWQKRFLKSDFSSFVIKQDGNSGELRWVNSTILKVH